MAEVIWTIAAISDLDAIADYIALDKPEAARRLVQRVIEHVEQLREHPVSGSRLPEMRASRYRQIVEPPCRVFYRHDGERVYILHVIRGEMRLKKSGLVKRDRGIGTSPGERKNKL